MARANCNQAERAQGNCALSCTRRNRIPPAVMDITPITASACNYPGSGSTSHTLEQALSGRLRMPTGEQAGLGPDGTAPKALNSIRPIYKGSALTQAAAAPPTTCICAFI